MRSFFLFLIVGVLVIFFSVSLAATFVDDTESEFSSGTHANTAWDTNHVELPLGQTSGTYTSRVFDGGAGAAWTGLAWSETLTSVDKLVIVDKTADVLKSVDNAATWSLVKDDYNAGDGNNADDMVSDSSGAIFIVDGQDVWKSTDVGTNWTKVTDDYNGDSDNSNARKIAIHSNNTLYIAEADEEIWTSTDSGINWTKVSGDINGGNGDVVGFTAVGTTLYAVDAAADVWKSTDSAASWALVKDDYTGADSNNADYMTATSNGNLYILFGQDVWVSTNNGSEWTKVNDNYNGSESNDGLIIKRNSSNHLFIVEGDEDVWRSIDEGTTWTKQGATGGANTAGMVYVPVTTNITFGARSGDTSPPTANFAGSLTDPSGGNPSVSNARYFQYRATLVSDDNAVTPEMASVTVTYSTGVLAATSSVDTVWIKGGSTANNIVVSVGNDPSSTSAIQWVRVTRPYTNFTLTAGSATGWSASVSASAITFTGGSIAAGEQGKFTVTLDATAGDSAQTAWAVDADNDADGSSSVSASAASSGALSTGIDGTVPTNVGFTSVTADSNTQITASAKTATDASSGLSTTPYWFDETTGNTGGTDSTTWQASSSYSDSGLSASTEYCYRVKARDAVGNESSFSSASCATTNAAPDTTPPIISNMGTSAITETTVVVNWTTNENADSKMEYGQSTGYGTTVTDTTLLTAHSFQITGLTANTLYHFRVISKDSSGNTATSSDSSFLTQSKIVSGSGATADVAPPSLSGVSVSVTHDTATITFATNEFSRNIVEYGEGTTYGSTTLKSNLADKHIIVLEKLLPQKLYHYRISIEDVDNNKALSGDFSFTTALPPRSESATSVPSDLTSRIDKKTATVPSPVISGLSVAGIQPTSAKIIWETDIPATSQARFGTIPGQYPQVTSELAALTTDHAITLSDLQPKTTYYFVVISRTSDGGESISTEGSFQAESLEIQTIVDVKRPLALSVGSPGTQVPRTSAGETLTAVPILPTDGDSDPPITTLLAFVENPTENTSPVIRGHARDAGGVIASVAYSTDAGITWHPVTDIEGIGSSRAQFSARIPGLRDGNYSVLFRAGDNSGNIGASETKILIVDIQPPRTGANIVLSGSQSLIPDAMGRLSTLTGMTQRFVVSSVGGATSVDIIASLNTGFPEITSPSDTTSPDLIFPLTFSSRADLWFGDITFSTPGDYSLDVRARDGAGRDSVRRINPVSVSQAGLIEDARTGEPIAGAIVTLFQFSREENGFVFWPGAVFNQANPYTTGSDGSYRFLVPPGKFFLRVTHPRYQTTYSDIKEFMNHETINFTLSLSRKPHLSVALPFVGVYTMTFPVFPVHTRVEKPDGNNIERGSPPLSIIGRPAPLFSFPHTSGQSVDIRYLRGKRTIISVWNTWSPLAQAQIPLLDDMRVQNNEDINVVLLALQESPGVVESYLARGGYTLESFIDPSGVVTEHYPITTIPQHFFLDRRGIVRDMHVGFLDSAQLKQKLNEL